MFEDEINGNLTQRAHDINGESLTCYEGQLFAYYTDSNGDVICGNSRNPNYDNSIHNQGCRRAACMIEREFAYKIYAELQDPIAFRQLANAAGKYNLTPESPRYDISHPDSCQKVGGKNLRESCCGEYPDRFPYASIRSVCCNGQVTPLGTC